MRTFGRYAVAALLLALPTHADQTVTLAKREFSAGSPAAAFQQFFVDARRLAASTTPAWSSTDSDLSAWGPALIFGLLDRGVSNDTALALAAPLQSEGTAPLLLFRTLGLYAAKSRVPFADTSELRKTIDRNLGTLERAIGDVEAFTALPGMSDWGSIGAAAWLAYLELLYRDYFDLGDPGGARWNADGLRIVDQLLVRGRLSSGKGFRRDPREDELQLWPNALALHALMKAYENEELVRYETAAIEAVAALDGLRGDDGSYVSTPAKRDKDPRANAYLANALLLLFKDTGDAQYRDRAVGILRWLSGGDSVARDAGLNAHVGYLILLTDSLGTRPAENVLGRRPMRISGTLGTAPSAQAVDALAARLRPADFRYRDMFDGVLHTLLERAPESHGDFAYDYGDAPGYAATVLLEGGESAIAPRIVQREVALLSWPRSRDFDEVSFGAGALLAALDHPNAGEPPTTERALRRYVLLSGGLAFLDRDYFDWLDWLTNGGGFEYGATVIGAQIADTHLRYAEKFPGQRVAWLMQPLHVARALIAGADRNAWDGSRHVYRARPGTDEVWVLPNTMMILDLLHAHQLTGEAAYLTRAEDVADGIQVLWDEQRGAYYASSGQTGDNAYESLSTNSYAALALLRLSRATQKPVYHERALRVFEFIRRDLYGDGIVYHHVYRRRRTAGDIWCTGCNWRVLAELIELARTE